MYKTTNSWAQSYRIEDSLNNAKIPFKTHVISATRATHFISDEDRDRARNAYPYCTWEFVSEEDNKR